MSEARAGSIELWAGAECTVNRVGDRYFDQLQRTGHERRLDDLDRLALLGVRRLRFPVLWERCALEGGRSEQGFAWADARLARLEALGLTPIVGLVHHGSGPPSTHLCDDGFASGLAGFASAVARRYPWVTAFTPVNEPLTTARFSALYGLWHPHRRELGAFYRAVVNQVLATRDSMRAIRKVTPVAQLYQTEDIAQVFATPDLEAQARYENERRWLSLDLLFGRVGAEHALRAELVAHGVSPVALDSLCDEPCPPELIGVNYYLTSDRFLDSRLSRYPRALWGGNERQAYADVEAVRALPAGIVGHRAVLDAVWARYGVPCAITEAHLACHREDQARWLLEAWQGAHAARASGADVRAVTLWSAFGAVGWNNLVTRENGEYEPGAYDVRSAAPRPTALAAVARHLSRGEALDAGLLRGAGWWRRSTRLLYGDEPAALEDPARPRLLVIGSGAFARRVAELCRRRFSCVEAPQLADVEPRLRAAGGAPPAAIVWAIEPARRVPELELGRYATALRRGCARGARVLVLSSARVFDGWSARPYLESDAPAALRLHAIERALSERWPGALIVRGGFWMDPARRGDALLGALRALQRGRPLALAGTGSLSPVYLPSWLDVALDLLVDGERGVWHVVPRTACSPGELLGGFARRLGLAELLPPANAPLERRSTRGPLGPMRALASERGWPLADLDATLDLAIGDYQRALGAALG